MYKHILIPTDGSETADKAVDAGIDFARQANARITWFTAVPEYRLPGQGEVVSRKAISLDEHDRRSREQAEAIFAKVMPRAVAAGVECDSDYAQSDHPYQAIIASAERHGCDLILMASHGRHGISALLHGSETRDVLTHSSIPTLVYR
ncbi:MAG TPA: universal stress protein [Burkholderiales bacterium]|nr:universal stress protein [Burkholderiales bacterium]